MRIDTIRLINFRCWTEYTLLLTKRFTLLIGENGTGKTAILDSIAIATGSFLLGIPNLRPNEKRHITRDDERYSTLIMGQTPIKETQYQTMVRAEGHINSIPVNWARYKDIRTNQQDAKEIISIVKNLIKEITNPKTILPAIAYYGTGRLWKQLKATEKKTKGPTSRLDGYQDCLNPASDQKRFFIWFKTQEIAALQKKEQRHTLEVVREAIIKMIPNAKNAFWDLDWDELMIETEIQDIPQQIPFHLLSDGYRNMIGMVADIAYRMATLNPQLEADVIKQTEGIVLIDEIDLHLHPQWQREVVDRLLKTFPKVQFVATSHSPFIIQSLYGRDDVLLWDLEEGAPVPIESERLSPLPMSYFSFPIISCGAGAVKLFRACLIVFTTFCEINQGAGRSRLTFGNPCHNNPTILPGKHP